MLSRERLDRRDDPLDEAAALARHRPAGGSVDATRSLAAIDNLIERLTRRGGDAPIIRARFVLARALAAKGEMIPRGRQRPATRAA